MQFADTARSRLPRAGRLNMGDEGDAPSKGPAAKDTRLDWIRDRVVSSLKARDEAVVKALTGEAK